MAEISNNHLLDGAETLQIMGKNYQPQLVSQISAINSIFVGRDTINF